MIALGDNSGFFEGLVGWSPLTLTGVGAISRPNFSSEKLVGRRFKNSPFLPLVTSLGNVGIRRKKTIGGRFNNFIPLHHTTVCGNGGHPSAAVVLWTAQYKDRSLAILHF